MGYSTLVSSPVSPSATTTSFIASVTTCRSAQTRGLVQIDCSANFPSGRCLLATFPLLPAVAPPCGRCSDESLDRAPVPQGRFLNLMHTAAYTGLTPAYTEQNFFLPMCKRHELLPNASDSKYEKVALEAVSNCDGLAAVNSYQIWAYEVVQGEVLRPDSRISPPVHTRVNEEIKEVGKAAKRLHAYTYQVLPFIYTHLVSLSSSLFLMFNAFVKGLYFTPEASYTFGLILPACSVITTTLVVFGLLEVGDTILDPFGSDPEDFTVLHFIEFTPPSSLAAIEVDSMGPPLRERKPTTAVEAENFYSPEQTAGALRFVSRMIARYRARKAKERALMHDSMVQAFAAEQLRGESCVRKRRTSGGVPRDGSPNAAVISQRAALPEALRGGASATATPSSRSACAGSANGSSQHTDMTSEVLQKETQAKLQSWASEIERDSPPSSLSPEQVAEAKIEIWAAELAAERQEIREEEAAHGGEPPKERAPSGRERSSGENGGESSGSPKQRRKPARRHRQGGGRGNDPNAAAAMHQDFSA